MNVHFRALVCFVALTSPACDRGRNDAKPPDASSTCADPSLEILDVQADFRDIWAGRETIDTGKRTSRNPRIVLRFGHEVPPNGITASLIGSVGGGAGAPADCVDAPGPPAGEQVHRIVLRAEALEPRALRLIAPESLRGGCRYTLNVLSSPPVSSKTCPSFGDMVTFRTVTDDSTAFERETEKVHYDSARHFTSFHVKAGIHTPVDDALARYADAFKLRPGIDTLRRRAPPVESSLVPGQKQAVYEQYYFDLLVYGSQCIAWQRDGILSSAECFVVPGVVANLDDLRSEQDAVQRAAKIIRAKEPSWTPDQRGFLSAQLCLVNHGPDPKAAAGFVPAWRIKVQAEDYHWLDIDARSGAFLFGQPSKVQ
jgi:hypothetical protein